MRQFPILGFQWPLMGMAFLLVSTVAGAVNVNGTGASLNLSTTDLSSGTAQSNGAGARMVAAGTPGTGIVSTNGAGAKIIIEPVGAIAGNNGAPTADFSAYPMTGTAPLTVEFTSLASGGLYEIVSWSWDFGDGSPVSTAQNPVHTYEDPGTYTVALTVVTSAGTTVVETKEDSIAVTQGMPLARPAGLFVLAIAGALSGAFQLRKARQTSV